MEINPWKEYVYPYFHERWFIQCDWKICEERIIKRHVKTGVCNDAKSALDRWINNDKPNGIFLIKHLNKDKLNAIIISTEHNQIKIESMNSKHNNNNTTFKAKM